MASSTEGASKTTFQSQMAFVVGYTGGVGKELVKELLQRNIFKKVVLIGRRQVQLDGELYKNAEQKVVDFDNLAQHKAAFENCTVGFCCLGLPVAGAKKEDFVRINHDYVVGVAKLANELGVQHFSVVTGQGSNKDSFFLSPKTKGLAEQHVSEIEFPRTTIFRPALILIDRQETRFVESASRILLKPIMWAKPTWLSIPVNTLAKAMIADLWRKPASRVEIFENGPIHEMAKGVD